MDKKKVLGLSLLSGVLLGASWFPPLTFLIFLAWLPLLFVTKEIHEKAARPKGAIFLYSYITFLIWNAIVTWWTWFASPGGCVAAIAANSLLMSFTYWIFFILYRSLQKRVAPFSKWKRAAVWLLIPVWLSFEYLHTLWELAWTWLTLGNVFAYSHKWVQWYEFTGVSGGSLWVLAANILVFQLVDLRAPVKTGFWFRNRIWLAGTLIVLPIMISGIVSLTYEPGFSERQAQEIVVVQPNIDPYNDKFSSSYESQLQRAFDLVKGKITQRTNYLVFPETFFTENVWENNLEDSYSVRFLRDSILKKYPNLIIVTGASTFYNYRQGEKLSPTAHRYSDAEAYYDVYNTGLQIDNFGAIQIYHKSKLVPGVERMPYPAVFGFLEKLAIDLGGTSGSLGTQDKREVFYNKDRSVGVATVICYESVFGEYLGGFMEEGANLIFIITNDGWWNDSPGYVQHLNYARLRAIETRTPIARCANTGVSCFVNEKGELLQETRWWEPAVISSYLQPNNDKTFYVKYGDLLSKLALVLTSLLIILVIILRLKK